MEECMVPIFLKLATFRFFVIFRVVKFLTKRVFEAVELIKYVGVPWIWKIQSLVCLSVISHHWRKCQNVTEFLKRFTNGEFFLAYEKSKIDPKYFSVFFYDFSPIYSSLYSEYIRKRKNEKKANFGKEKAYNVVHIIVLNFYGDKTSSIGATWK